MVSSASHVGPKTEQICVGAFLKLFNGYWAVVKDHAAESLIDTIIQVVAKLAAADRLADDLSHRR